MRFATNRSAIKGGESSDPGTELRVKAQTLNASVTTNTAATPQVA